MEKMGIFQRLNIDTILDKNKNLIPIHLIHEVKKSKLGLLCKIGQNCTLCAPAFMKQNY